MDSTTSLLSWNVCGLNSRPRRDAVQMLVDDARPVILYLQETTLGEVPSELFLSMLGPQFRDYAFLPAANTCGGVIACWSSVATISDVLVRVFFVTLNIHLMGTDDPWWLICVYGPQPDDAKVLFLQELEAIRYAC